MLPSTTSTAVPTDSTGEITLPETIVYTRQTFPAYHQPTAIASERAPHGDTGLPLQELGRLRHQLESISTRQQQAESLRKTQHIPARMAEAAIGHNRSDTARKRSRFSARQLTPLPREQSANSCVLNFYTRDRFVYRSHLF